MDLDQFIGNDFAAEGNDAEAILKAMEAGLGTGRDYTDTIHNGPGLKVESLDPMVKVLENKMEQLWTWLNIPKQPIYNTVHEYNQLFKHGEEVGIFNIEGETPQSTDSQYRRKSVTAKFTGVTGQVSHPSLLAKYADGKDPLAREVQNKTMLLLTLLNAKIVNADSSKVNAEFDGLFREHVLGINDIYGGVTGATTETILDRYYGDIAVVDADGSILTDALVEQACNVSVNERNGMMVSHIISNPVVFSNYAKQFHDSKYVMVNNPTSGTTDATMGQRVREIATQFGTIGMGSDVFFDKRPAKKYNAIATSDKAPVVPVVGGTPTAVNTDTKTNFTNHAGNYFYGVVAKNRYGESPMLPINTVTQAVAATESADIEFTAGVGGYAAESFVIYRTEANAAPYTTANYYPLFEVSTTELAAGYDGAAAGFVRDRNRIIANTKSAFVLYHDAEVWEYLQYAPTMRMDYAVTSPSRRFSVLNYGAPAFYQPGKVVRIVNIGTATA